jgi:thiosulfate dehydrogenase
MKIFTFFAVSLILATTLTLAYGHGKKKHIPTKNIESTPIKLGAQLYDNWLKFTDHDPAGNHPLYPTAGIKSGESTWRCKECHGWDYIGKNGRYRSGSHYTGIEGVLAASHKDDITLKDILNDKASQHDFSPYLSEEQLECLVVFIKKGLFETASILYANGKANGNVKRGASLFTENCAACHGEDGNDLDFKDKKEGTQGVGWIANDNPQESLHKIRWGHPGTEMPSLVSDAKLEDNDAIDILTYAQTLE